MCDNKPMYSWLLNVHSMLALHNSGVAKFLFKVCCAKWQHCVVEGYLTIFQNNYYKSLNRSLNTGRA